MAKKIHWIGILNNDTARKVAARYALTAPDGYVCRIEEATRSLDQNAHQWPYLEGFSKQKEIMINGAMTKVDADTWKEILTAAFKAEQMRFAVYNGQTILLPQRTSTMGKRLFSEWLEWLIAEAHHEGVTPVFKNPREE